MIAIICGGRDYQDSQTLNNTRDQLHSELTFTTIIHGAAKGADSLAGRWAKSTGIRVQEFPARWNHHDPRCGPRCRQAQYCRRAGFRRNEQMLTEGQPDIVIAFPGGRGTQGMIDLARNANVPVRTVPA